LLMFAISRSFDVVYSTSATLSLRYQENERQKKKKKKKKVKFSCTCHEDVGYMGNRGKTPVILNFGNGRRWLIGFRSRQIYQLESFPVSAE